MKAVVYYVTLSDEQYEALNLRGWDSDIGRQYDSAKYKGVTPQNAHLFVPAAKGDFGDAEEAWTKLQNVSDSWSDNKDIECLTTRPRSMDVGDLICWEDGRWERCDRIGFVPSNNPHRVELEG